MILLIRSDYPGTALYCNHLNSIMILLIRNTNQKFSYTDLQFKFHYDSINSEEPPKKAL